MKTIEEESIAKRMREIRDQLNKRFEDMAYQEEPIYQARIGKNEKEKEAAGNKSKP